MPLAARVQVRIINCRREHPSNPSAWSWCGYRQASLPMRFGTEMVTAARRLPSVRIGDMTSISGPLRLTYSQRQAGSPCPTRILQRFSYRRRALPPWPGRVQLSLLIRVGQSGQALAVHRQHRSAISPKAPSELQAAALEGRPRSSPPCIATDAQQRCACTFPPVPRRSAATISTAQRQHLK